MATILLVEDTPANRALATKLLVAAGHDVADRGDRRERDRHRPERLPDLVLMDLGLPDMNGWEALTEIRADTAVAGSAGRSRSPPTRWSATASGRSPRGSTAT